MRQGAPLTPDEHEALARPYMPSIRVLAEIKREGLSVRVKMALYARSKTARLTLYQGKVTAASTVVQYGGIPRDHVPTQEAVDKCWRSMLGSMLRVVLHRDG
jgi:hypothetical protein